MIPVCVADTTDKAWEIAGAGPRVLRQLLPDAQGPAGRAGAAEDQRVTQEMLRSGNAGFWFAAVGTPEDVIAKLRPFVDGHLGRITQLALQMRQPGMNNARHPPVDADVRRARSSPRSADAAIVRTFELVGNRARLDVEVREAPVRVVVVADHGEPTEVVRGHERSRRLSRSASPR